MELRDLYRETHGLPQGTLARANGSFLVEEGRLRHETGKFSINSTRLVDKQEEQDLVAGDFWRRRVYPVERRDRKPGPVTVGRVKGCDVQIELTSISAAHATFISPAKGQWTLVDAGSKNGTSVNGQKLQKGGVSVPVRNGDLVAFGPEIKLTFLDGASMERVLRQLDPALSRAAAQAAKQDIASLAGLTPAGRPEIAADTETADAKAKAGEGTAKLAREAGGSGTTKPGEGTGKAARPPAPAASGSGTTAKPGEGTGKTARPPAAPAAAKPGEGTGKTARPPGAPVPAAGSSDATRKFVKADAATSEIGTTPISREVMAAAAADARAEAAPRSVVPPSASRPVSQRPVDLPETERVLAVTCPPFPPVGLVTGVPVSIGRAVGNDLILPHPNVSRRHATFERHGEELMVRDLGSGNGTWVDKKKATELVPIALGQEVGIGPYKVSIQPEKADAPTTNPDLGTRLDIDVVT